MRFSLLIKVVTNVRNTICRRMILGLTFSIQKSIVVLLKREIKSIRVSKAAEYNILSHNYISRSLCAQLPSYKYYISLSSSSTIFPPLSSCRLYIIHKSSHFWNAQIRWIYSGIPKTRSQYFTIDFGNVGRERVTWAYGSTRTRPLIFLTLAIG